MQTSQNMQVSAVFLHTTLERFCAKFAATASSIAECVFKSPLFKLDRKPIIERGIHSLFQGDWLVGAHLLIPQIEEAIRTLIELAGGSPLKPSKSGGLDVKTLDELLRDPVTVGVLGEDASSYLRVLLTDRRGWNIRNNICHGLYSPEYFGPMISDRLMHVLLCIAQVRENQPETS